MRLWNDRGSILTMGFKLSCGNDLETLKNMESIYKEESHVHQFIIPFETTVWNEEDLPRRRSQQNNAPNVSTDQGTQQNNSSGSEQSTGQNNEQ